MKVSKLSSMILAAVVVSYTVVAQAITIGTVPVGDPGNTADTRYATPGYGAVGYTYNIGQYEVTAGQYTAFLNAVAATDTYGLYNTSMADPSYPVWGCNIQRSGSSGSYIYSVASDWANRPVNYVSWGDAARFANWMHNGQHTGVQDLSTTEGGSYYVNGATRGTALSEVTRMPNATWVIPSEDEWYKAAYYDPNKLGGAGYWDYPTKSDNETPPINILLTPDPGNHANFGFAISSPYYRTEIGAFTNSASAYGTFDQGGNVWEWNEAILYGDQRGARGGAFGNGPIDMAASLRNIFNPTGDGDYSIGFRVANVPEPGSLAILLGLAMAALLRWRKRA